MIPKIIHYCWLSNDPVPTDLQECIRSWRLHMPDWTLKLWNTKNFDIHSVPFVEQACRARKWAFAADYIRIHALWHEGGVYLDSDVLVRKNMDFVLANRAFSAIEYFPHLAEQIEKEGLLDASGHKLDPASRIHGIQIQAAILGAEKGHPFFKDCLDYYRSATFTTGPDGTPEEREISPIILAGIAEKYGFVYQDREQQLAEGFRLYPSELFCSQPYLMKKQAVAVHCCNASWRHVQRPADRFLANAKVYVKRFLRMLGRREKEIDAIR